MMWYNSFLLERTIAGKTAKEQSDEVERKMDKSFVDHNTDVNQSILDE